MTGFTQPERRGLQRTQTAAPGSHPDADLLAAFSEHSLTAPEQEQVLAHLAACPTCREVLVLAGSQLVEPVPEPLRKRGMWEIPLFHWGAAAATAIIVVFAIAIGVRDHKLARQSAATATFNEVAPPAPVTAQPPAATDRVETDKVQVEPQSKPVEGLVAGSPAAATPQNAMATPTLTTTRAKHLQEQFRYERPADEARAPQAPAPEKKDLGVTADAIRGRRAEPLPTQAVSETQANQVGASQSGTLFKKRIPMVQPWRIVNGQLQHAEGAGAWEDVLPGHQVFSYAIGGNQVFAGGADGHLYASSDNGAHWVAISVHDGDTHVNGNITEIHFSDAQNGTLSTSAAETWTTSDGGQTWHKQ